MNNSYYNISLSLTVEDSENGTLHNISDNFIFVVGKVSLFLKPVEDRVLNYKDSFMLDYSTAFDPMQPETAILKPIWSCSPGF